MKKMILALAAAMTMTAAMAQGDNQQGRRNNGQRFDRTEMIKMRTDRTVEQYKLNGDQAKQLLELNTKFADTMGPGMGGMMRGGDRRGGAGMRNGNGAPGQQGQRPELTEEQRKEMEARRAQQEKAQKEYDEELQKIMTEEQYKAYKDDQAKMRERFGQRGGGQRAGGRRNNNQQ